MATLRTAVIAAAAAVATAANLPVSVKLSVANTVCLQLCEWGGRVGWGERLRSV